MGVFFALKCLQSGFSFVTINHSAIRFLISRILFEVKALQTNFLLRKIKIRYFHQTLATIFVARMAAAAQTKSSLTETCCSGNLKVKELCLQDLYMN